MCGSLGNDLEGRLIGCGQCGQCYHPHCVNVKVNKCFEMRSAVIHSDAQMEGQGYRRGCFVLENDSCGSFYNKALPSLRMAVRLAVLSCILWSPFKKFPLSLTN